MATKKKKTTTKKAAGSVVVSALQVVLQQGTDSSVYATWSPIDSGKYSSKFDHYTVTWAYYTGNKNGNSAVWFDGGSTDVKTIGTNISSLYSVPSNALQVRCTVKTVSKTKKKGKKKVNQFTGGSVSSIYYVTSTPPETPSAPSVSVDKYKLTAVLDTTDSKTNKVQFEVLQNEKGFGGATVNVVNNRASYVCNVAAGSKYRVRCRAINVFNGKDIYSKEWSAYSSDVETLPNAVSNVTLKVTEKTSVKLTWTGSATATSYKIEYTTNKDYFDTGASVSSVTTETTTGIVTGLETGKTWYFRVQATNSQGSSGWSKVLQTTIGSKPDAPTTWSSTTTGVIGEDIYLYWVHNTEDGSSEVAAEVYLRINGKNQTITVNRTSDDNEISQYKLNLSGYSDGATIVWWVRTKGITGEYGPWSMERTINIYSPPTLGMNLSATTIKALPFTIGLSAGPSSQNAVTYEVEIIATEEYETNDYNGDEIIIAAGEVIFSKIYTASSNSLSVSINAGNISLEGGQTYKIHAVVSMSSGLTAEVTRNITTDWQETEYEPDGMVVIDEDKLCAYITPFCRDDEDALMEGCTLAVYRREYDGSFVEIGSGLPNDGVTTVTDPHPALDYARYRIVARETDTSNTSYMDLPGEPFDEGSLVIQWDEDWSDFNYDIMEDEPVNAPLSGSMVKLPYNIDTSESHDMDVELVEYAGRKHPVSYYGTQRGESGTWSCVIEADDVDTLYALRRLANYAGDVYVRNPSGVGYWANITVSISQTHNSLIIPVSFTIKRVEGGV